VDARDGIGVFEVQFFFQDFLGKDTGLFHERVEFFQHAVSFVLLGEP